MHYSAVEATSTATVVPVYQIILDYVNVLIWPIVVTVVLFAFRGVFNFLFLSLKEFNFLGAKGGIRSPEEVIREMATNLYEKERRERETQENAEKTKRDFAILEESVDKTKSQNQKLIKFAEGLIDDTGRLQALADSQRRQIEALLVQVSLLQGNTPQPSSSVISGLVAQAEEQKDVGSVSPQTTTSDNPSKHE